MEETGTKRQERGRRQIRKQPDSVTTFLTDSPSKSFTFFPEGDIKQSIVKVARERGINVIVECMDFESRFGTEEERSRPAAWKPTF